jgi:DNA-binding Lrp family transcriptional regulator
MHTVDRTSDYRTYFAIILEKFFYRENEELYKVFLMVTAIVLLKVESDLINEVAEQIIEIEGISEVYSIAGRFDLVAIVRVKDNEGLADVVTSQMLKVKGIINSETLIAFRVFSKFDLDRMFSIGIE